MYPSINYCSGQWTISCPTIKKLICKINKDGNKTRKLHTRRIKGIKLGTVPALQYSLLPKNNKDSLKIFYKDSRQPGKKEKSSKSTNCFP